jgi:hypothetical protein
MRRAVGRFFEEGRGQGGGQRVLRVVLQLVGAEAAALHDAAHTRPAHLKGALVSVNMNKTSVV